MTSADDWDPFELELGAAAMAARYDIATEAVAAGVLLAAAGRREGGDYPTWQALSSRFKQDLYDAPGAAGLMTLAERYADTLAAALVELAEHRRT